MMEFLTMMCQQHDDWTLVKQIAAGCGHAFTEIDYRYRERLIRYARRLFNTVGNNEGYEEDAVQEAFTKLHQHAAGLSPEEETLQSWLYKVTGSKVCDKKRTEYRRKNREDEVAKKRAAEEDRSPRGNDPPVNDQDKPRIVLDIEDCLRTLDDDCRTMILRRFYEGRTWVELGGAMGLSQYQASRRVEKCLSSMRACMTQKGYDETDLR